MQINVVDNNAKLSLMVKTAKKFRKIRIEILITVKRKKINVL